MTEHGIEGRCETIHDSKFGGYTFTKSRSTKSCERGIVMLVIILLIQQSMSISVSTSYFASGSRFGEASNPGPSYSIGWSSEQICALSQSDGTGGYSQSMACDQMHREISHMSQSTELKREFDQPTKSTKQKEDTDNSTYRFDPFLNAIFEAEDHQEGNDGTGTTQDVPVTHGIANIQDVDYVTEINTSLSFGPHSGLQPLTPWCNSAEQCVLGVTAESNDGEPDLGGDPEPVVEAQRNYRH